MFGYNCFYLIEQAETDALCYLYDVFDKNYPLEHFLDEDISNHLHKKVSYTPNMCLMEEARKIFKENRFVFVIQFGKVPVKYVKRKLDNVIVRDFDTPPSTNATPRKPFIFLKNTKLPKKATTCNVIITCPEKKDDRRNLPFDPKNLRHTFKEDKIYIPDTPRKLPEIHLFYNHNVGRVSNGIGKTIIRQ